MVHTDEMLLAAISVVLSRQELNGAMDEMKKKFNRAEKHFWPVFVENWRFFF